MDKIDEGLAGLKAQIESLAGSVDKLIAQRTLLLNALAQLLPLVDHLDDEGPEGSRWQSDELQAAIDDAENALEAMK
jgi:hypothetical protein